MWIAFNSFSHRGTGKAHSEDSVFLDGKVHQGRVREGGAVDTYNNFPFIGRVNLMEIK